MRQAPPRPGVTGRSRRRGRPDCANRPACRRYRAPARAGPPRARCRAARPVRPNRPGARPTGRRATRHRPPRGAPRPTPPPPSPASGGRWAASRAYLPSLGGSGQRVVLGLERLDQAVDAAAADLGGKRAAVVGHQRHAGHDHIVDLPVLALLLERVVDLDRFGARLTHLGAHRHIGVAGFGPQRLEVNLLVAVLGQRVGIGAHQQRAELADQAVALRRGGLAPVAANGQRGHDAEIEMRQHLLVDQGRGPRGIARLDRLVLAHDLEHFVHHRAHQRIGRRCRPGAHTHQPHQPGHQGFPSKHVHSCQFSCSR